MSNAMPNAMSNAIREMRQLFERLEPGDRVEVEHQVTVGLETWPTKTEGFVVKTERRRRGLHFERSRDDDVFSDLIVLKRDDGELTTVNLDEFTTLQRLDNADS